MFAPDVNRADCGFPHKESKGSCSKTSLVSQSCFSILYLECTHTHIIYTSLPVFFFLSFFPILWFVYFFYFFPISDHFFLEFTILRKKIPISSKTICSHSAKNHCSVQNFFCFSTPDLFAMTVHVTFPSPPRLLQS
jgi:hypothetical protein